MKRLPHWLLFAALAFAAPLVPACKEKAAEKKSNNSDDAEKTKTKTETEVEPTQTNTKPQTNPPTNRPDDCEKPGSSTKTKTKTNTKTNTSQDAEEDENGEPILLTAEQKGFNLRGVSYEDIKDILDDKCVSCHGSGKPTDLSTYSKAKAKTTKIKAEIEDGDMPPDGKPALTATEKTKILDWIEDGALEKEEEEEEEEVVADGDEPEVNNGGSNDDCDEEENEGDQNELDQAFNELLNPPEFKECVDKGRVFDRGFNSGEGKCLQTKIATFDCDADGIVEKFKKAGVTVKKSSDGKTIDGFEGYKIDQCGELDNDPLIFFYKRVPSTEVAKIEVKMLCKKGSPACDKK